MKQPWSVSLVRSVAVIFIAALFLLSVAVFSSAGVLPVQARPDFQDPTAYPYPTQPDPFDFPYPYPVETEPELDFQPYPPVEDTDRPPTRFTPVPQQTLTLPPNTFLTENAEMGNGQVTPLGGTPEPIFTPTSSPTLASDTPQPTPIITTVQGSSGRLNWGLFWIGFSMPVLAACGWVLYLLDRRPELFRPRG